MEATASSLTLDDSIDQSTSTVQNANQETVIANSTGNLLNDPTSYYVAAPNELIDNETNSSPIVFSNNVSTNRLLQQGKPNTTFESRIVETINESPSGDRNDRNKQINMYTDQINGGTGGEMSVFNYAASSPGPPDQFSSQPISTSTLSSTTARASNKNKNHYEFLNTNSLPLPPIREQASPFSQPSYNGNQPSFNGNPQQSFGGSPQSFNGQQSASAFKQQAASFNQQQSSFVQNAASKLLPPIDDLIEFRLNGSTPFSNFIADKATSLSSTPVSSPSTTPNSPLSSQMTPTPSTITHERSAGAAASALAAAAGGSGESISADSMPELYNAPLSSFASTLQQVNQQKHKSSNGDKNLHLNSNIIPKNMPSSHSDGSLPPTNQTSLDHPTNPVGSQSGENRYRWVNNYTNRNKLPPYPPKQPNIPG